jgi:LacI family transcriptional regulator, galactose operon repressor
MAKRPSTLREIARLAGVAPSTASGVLNGKNRVSPETRFRVLTAVRTLNYRPNTLARSLRVRKTRTIGLIIPSVTNPFYTAVARGAEDAAFTAGYDVLLCNSDRDPAKERAYITSLLDKWVDGLIFAAPMVGSDDLLDVKFNGAAVVVMNQSVDDSGIDEIWMDFRIAASEVVEYLVGLGHRHIGFISGPPTISRFKDRLDGFRETLERLGLLDERFIRFGGYDEDSGYGLARSLVESSFPPTAIFCANDVLAVGALGAITDLGLHVPKHVSLVGFDDIPIASHVRPKLTTVYQPSHEAGQAAVKLALARIADGDARGKQRLQLETRLVVRDSAASPPSLREPTEADGVLS